MKKHRRIHALELGRSPAGIMMGLGMAMALAIVAAVFIPMFSSGSAPGSVAPALAHKLPADCDGFIGSAGATISIDPAPIPPIEPNETLNYRVAAVNNLPVSGIACTRADGLVAPSTHWFGVEPGMRFCNA